MNATQIAVYPLNAMAADGVALYDALLAAHDQEVKLREVYEGIMMFCPVSLHAGWPTEDDEYEEYCAYEKQAGEQSGWHYHGVLAVYQAEESLLDWYQVDYQHKTLAQAQQSRLSRAQRSQALDMAQQTALLLRTLGTVPLA